MKKIIGKIAILLVQVFTVTSHFFCNKYNIIFSSEKDHLGDWSPEKDCCWWLTFRNPVREPSSESSSPFYWRFSHILGSSFHIAFTFNINHFTLKMTSVESSVTNNSPSQDSNHSDDLFQMRYVTLGLKKPIYYLTTILTLCIVSSPSVKCLHWCIFWQTCLILLEECVSKQTNALFKEKREMTCSDGFLQLSTKHSYLEGTKSIN